MASGFPPSVLQRLSFVFGKLYFRALDLEVQELGHVGVDVKQQAVLSLLADEGPMTQQQVGQRLGIDRTTIVTVVDGLERKKMVERRRSPVDRRAYQLTLTSAGQYTQRRGQQHVGNAENALLGALDEAERRLLVQLLAKLLDTH